MYSKNQLYFFLYMIAVTSLVEGAPSYYPFNDTESSSVNKEIVGILLESILSNNDSLAVIGRLFKKVPSTTVCVHISYIVTCTEQTDCNDDTIMCEDGHISTKVWTLFNSRKTSGQLLYYFLTTWPTLPGFDWDEACVSIDDSINVNIPTLPCLDSTDELEDSLSYIATLMYSISLNKNVIPPFDKQTAEGFASNTIYTYSTEKITYVTIAYCMGLGILIYSIGTLPYISKKLLPTISGKPTFYYQYWAAILLGSVYSIIQWTIESNDSIAITTGYNISFSILLIAFHCMEYFWNTKSEYTYSSPAAILPCPCGHLISTIYGNIITCILINYFIYFIPNIVIVYYLYPIRTIKRVPLLLGGIFSMITLIARLIYLIEKLSELIKYGICHKICRYERKQLLCCGKRQDDDYHFSYYANKIRIDLVNSNWGDRAVKILLVPVQVVFLIIIIGVYGYAQVLLAQLAFTNDRTSNPLISDNSSIIIALIPSILVALATGAGIGIFNKVNIRNIMNNKNIADSLKSDSTKDERKGKIKINKKEDQMETKLILNYSMLDEVIAEDRHRNRISRNSDARKHRTETSKENITTRRNSSSEIELVVINSSSEVSHTETEESTSIDEVYPIEIESSITDVNNERSSRTEKSTRTVEVEVHPHS